MPTPAGQWWPTSWAYAPPWNVRLPGTTGSLLHKMDRDGFYWLRSDTSMAKLGNLAGQTVYGAWTDDGLGNDEMFNYAVPKAPDTTAPSVPSGLAVTDRTINSLTVTWSASTDDEAVTGYKVYRDAVLVGSPTTTSFADSGLTPDTSYAYTVTAVDAAGNESAAGSVTAVTLSDVDTEAPGTPTGLQLNGVAHNTVGLTWTAPTDNVAVAGYVVRRGGVVVGNPSGTSYTATGLTPSTVYAFTVSAVDAAGNESPETAPVAVTTTVEPPWPLAMWMGEDVVDFLGQSGDSELVALAERHVVLIAAMVKAYTRGGGFSATGEPTEELKAVIITATARLLANPEQLDTTVGGVRTGAGFSGWTLAELFVLNRYRRRAT